MKNNRFLPQLALLIAAVIWGTSFVVMKNTVDIFPVNTLLAIRFGLGALILAVLSVKKLRRINKEYIIKGSVVGIFMYLGYIFQTYGLTHTTPGKNAFLTAVYCVIVPFLVWLLYKQKPDKYNITAAFLCLLGIGLVSLKGDFSIGIGDLLTLVGGVFFALQVVTLNAGSRGKDTILFTVVIFTASFIPALIGALCFETFPAEIPPDSIWGMGYLVVFATCLALTLQTFGQRSTPAPGAAILLSLESVFGVLTSLIVGEETMTLRLGIGFLVIFIAVIVSETKLSFLWRKKLSDGSMNME